jgi:hypothetical protein
VSWADRPYCGVYVFNLIKVGGGGDDALKDWEVSVLRDLRSVRTLTLKDVGKLPMDAAGYHILKIEDYSADSSSRTEELPPQLPH